MVQFEKDKNGVDFFKIEVRGERENYIDLIKSLLTMIHIAPDTQELQNEFYDICNLIEYMLPDSDQIINKEDAELLKELKSKRK